METSKQARPLLGCSLCACVFFLSLGCEEIASQSVASCTDLMYRCDDSLVPPISDAYCSVAVRSTDGTCGTTAEQHEAARWAQCEAFRRGSVCQCLTPVCVDILQYGLLEDLTMENLDVLDDLFSFQCPGMDAYSYH